MYIYGNEKCFLVAYAAKHIILTVALLFDKIALHTNCSIIQNKQKEYFPVTNRTLRKINMKREKMTIASHLGTERSTPNFQYITEKRREQ